jgi:D-threonate/D-erythronate kinase
MPSLTLLADDLTGALDTSAEFVGLFGPLDVFWSAASVPENLDRFSIDSGTRECGANEAFAIARELAPLLDGATIAYKKIDSLLRGPWVAEVDACLQAGRWNACIVAPAFAHQGRRTHAGQQYALASDGSWAAVGKTIIQQIRERGLEARLGDPAAELQPGISVFDAETDDDLDRVVQIGRRYAGAVLWCGSGGLASALARGKDVGLSGALKRPVLGVFGSDHPATAAQLVVCESLVVRDVDVPSNLDRIRQRLNDGIALVKLEPPGGASRVDAAQHFARQIMHLVRSINPPGTLLIAGGETLKAVSVAVRARALRVFGRLEPGVPKSVIQSGSWAGVDVISKSGAFGPPDLWWKLLRQNGLI